MAKDFYTSPRLGVYDHKPHVDLLYNTNLHVDPTEINTYLAFFIIASFVCLMYFVQFCCNTILQRVQFNIVL